MQNPPIQRRETRRYVNLSLMAAVLITSIVAFAAPPVSADEATCGGKALTPVRMERQLINNETVFRIFGTSGDDVILGTQFRDIIVGGSGRDLICGGGGNDQIDGGAGKDDIWGGDGDDVLIGGRGNDTMYGQDGIDDMDGGAGRDRLIGGAGNDWLKGKGGDDLLKGQIGFDNLLGGVGEDRLFGGPGNDRLHGGQGDDTLDGEAGDDTLYGDFTGSEFDFATIDQASLAKRVEQRGNDTLHGGDGNDVLEGWWGDDRLDGGAGDDILRGDPAALVRDPENRERALHGDDGLSGGPGNDQLLGFFGGDRFDDPDAANGVGGPYCTMLFQAERVMGLDENAAADAAARFETNRELHCRSVLEFFEVCASRGGSVLAGPGGTYANGGVLCGTKICTGGCKSVIIGKKAAFVVLGGAITAVGVATANKAIIGCGIGSLGVFHVDLDPSQLGVLYDDYAKAAVAGCIDGALGSASNPFVGCIPALRNFLSDDSRSVQLANAALECSLGIIGGSLDDVFPNKAGVLFAGCLTSGAGAEYSTDDSSFGPWVEFGLACAQSVSESHLTRNLP